MTKPTEIDQQAQNEEWRKIAEEICHESTPERILELSRELIELLDKKTCPRDRNEIAEDGLEKS